MAYWVQTSPTEELKSNQRWQELLLSRLTNKFDGVVREHSTDTAEDILMLGSNSYYYVGSPREDFGLICVAYELGAPDAVKEVRVSPFDTGGFAISYIPTTQTLTDGEKQQYVAQCSYAVPEYHSIFAAWVDGAFPEFGAYVRGDSPSHVFADIVNLPACTDSRAWLWEGRVPIGASGTAVLAPIRGFAPPTRIRRYLTWLAHRDELLDAAQLASHTSSVLELFIDVDDPIEEMCSYLIAGGLHAGV